MMLSTSCQQQKTNDKMEHKNNPLLCDTATGVCEVLVGVANDSIARIIAMEKPVKLIYFTDPICSSCWGIEPQLRRLKLEYGQDVAIEYHMGGLLPDWSYNSGGISKPSDVAHHWDEVSLHYNMPIDGDIWLEDPLSSSYPPSIAFKAAQMQDEHKATIFMRHLREMVFLQKKNIAKWEHIQAAAVQAGLDADKLKQDYDGDAKALFEKDLALARQMGVRGFPTIFATNKTGSKEMVYGSRSYASYTEAIHKIQPGVRTSAYSKDWERLFAAYPTLTTREYAELADISIAEADKLLQKLLAEQNITAYRTKNGPLWKKK
jgi:predicted DsbA family dithiol-disulfide isomerase